MTRSNPAAAAHLAADYTDSLEITSYDSQRQRSHGGRQRPKRGYKAGFSHEKALVYGVVHCLAGVAYVVLGVISVATGAWGNEFACALWAGALCLLAGVSGLAASRRKTNMTIISFMVVSAMAAIAALITLAISSVGIVADHSLFDEVDMSSYSSALVVHSLTIVVSVVAAFCGSIGSIVGCRGVCGAWYGMDDLPIDDVQDVYSHPNDYAAMAPGVYSDSMDPSVMTSGGPSQMAQQIPGGHNAHNSHLPLLGNGYQQIAIVPPGSTLDSEDPNSRMIIMQSTGHGNQGLSQVMYILQAGAPCPQPGQPVPDSTDTTHCSPPPSYSTLALDALSRSGDSQQLDLDRTSGSTSDHDNGSDTHDLSTSYSYDISCPSNITNIILQDLCRLTNNPHRVVTSSANRSRNASYLCNQTVSVQHDTSQEVDPHGDDYYALREGETSFSSEWADSAHPNTSASARPNTSSSSFTAANQSSSTSATSQSETVTNRPETVTNQPDVVAEQELPLLEASPQRYRPRHNNSTNSRRNEESLMTYI